MAGGNQNSLDNIIGIFGDLGTNLHLLNKETSEEVVETVGNAEDEEKLNDLIDNLEDLQATVQLFQREIEEEPINDLINSFHELEAAVNDLRSDIPRHTTENIEEVSNGINNIMEDSEQSQDIFSGTKRLLDSAVRIVSGGESEVYEEFKLTYLDVIILVLFILGFFFILSICCILVSYCWRRLAGRRRSWRDLSQSETDSSVSWISIDTTSTQDTPVKPLHTVPTAKLAPIPEQKIMMIPGEFLVENQQWCRTEISPSIIV